MTEEQMPLWAKQFQGELLRGLQGVQNSIKDMVSRDTFRDEKTRVNDEFRKVADELKEARDDNKTLQADLARESSARQNAELAAAKKATEEAQARQKVQSQTNWQWFLLLAVPALNWIFDWLRSGVGP